MERAASVMEMLERISALTGERLDLHFNKVRPGDQPLYIANTAKLREHTGWQPRRNMDQILDAILAFWKQNLASSHSQAARTHADLAHTLQQEVA